MSGLGDCFLYLHLDTARKVGRGEKLSRAMLHVTEARLGSHARPPDSPGRGFCLKVLLMNWDGSVVVEVRLRKSSLHGAEASLPFPTRKPPLSHVPRFWDGR